MPRLLNTYMRATEMEMLSHNGDCGKNCGTPTFVKPATSSHMCLDAPTFNALNLTTVEGIARGTTFSTKICAYLIVTCQEQRTHSILIAVDRKCQAVHRIFIQSLKIHTHRSRNKDVQAVSYCNMGYFEVTLPTPSILAYHHYLHYLITASSCTVSLGYCLAIRFWSSDRKRISRMNVARSSIDLTASISFQSPSCSLQ